MQRQVDSVIENYFCQKLFGGLFTLPEIKEKVKDLKPEQLILRLAQASVGITEQGGDNSGSLVESMQKTCGTPHHQAWCMDFQQTLEAVCERWLDVVSSLPVGESCVEVFNAEDRYAKDPEPNDIIVWALDSNPSLGHCGRVTAAGTPFIRTIEGNTSGDEGLERNGDGVFYRFRHLQDYKTMRLLGFIKVTYKQKEGDL